MTPLEVQEVSYGISHRSSHGRKRQDQQRRETRSRISTVLAEVYSIAGRYDLAAIIRVKTNDDMAKVVTERIRKVERHYVIGNFDFFPRLFTARLGADVLHRYGTSLTGYGFQTFAVRRCSERLLAYQWLASLQPTLSCQPSAGSEPRSERLRAANLESPDNGCFGRFGKPITPASLKHAEKDFRSRTSCFQASLLLSKNRDD